MQRDLFSKWQVHLLVSSGIYSYRVPPLINSLIITEYIVKDIRPLCSVNPEGLPKEGLKSHNPGAWVRAIAHNLAPPHPAPPTQVAAR